VKPKILHLTQATGGVETSLLLLLRHLDHQRFEFHLACPVRTGLAEAARELGVPVHEIPMVRRADPLWDSVALARLLRLVRRERYAVIHAHSAKGGYLGRLAARLVGEPRTVYAPRAFSYLSQRGLARSIFLRLERIAVQWTDAVHAASESEKARAIQEVGFSPDRVTVIPNSVDIAETVAVSREPRAREKTILTVGRLAYQKNPEMFVRVARLVADRVPDANFVVLGSGFAGPLERRIEDLVRTLSLGTQLRIIPWANRPETLRQMAAARVFVLTSRFEGMPNTLLEAMAVGTPAVATDVDGTRDVLGAGRGGFLVPLDDDEAMARRLVALLEDSAMARDIGREGQALVRECYDIRRNAPAVETLYAKVLVR
jgi:glycosyltransferase involved in cell wall biosynthesis